VYKGARGRQIDTNQFSVTEHFKKNDGPVGRSLPGIFFFYDLSPIKVRLNSVSPTSLRSCAAVTTVKARVCVGRISIREISSRGCFARPPNPSNTNVARTKGFIYATQVWAVCLVQGPFSVSPRAEPCPVRIKPTTVHREAYHNGCTAAHPHNGAACYHTQVHFTERRQSLLQFVTSVCAIVGGVFTVSGLIDSFVYQGHKVIKKKLELGKLG
jgi:hypothetical protein